MKKLTSDSTSANGMAPKGIFVSHIAPNGTSDHTKLRGGYYTPDVVGAFLAAWGVESGMKVLEPSAGSGDLVRAAARRIGDGDILAVELDPQEAAKIAALNLPNAQVVNDDLFSWYESRPPDSAFDCVLGNPPFIRYQDFPEKHRTPAFELMRREGLNPNGLTNAWAPFVVAATRALRIGGRLALVLPAELLQVGYAAEIREYLVKHYSDIVVITFRRLIFKEIQQETILLLGIRSRRRSVANLTFVELDDAEDLADFDPDEIASVPIELNKAREKWTQFYLSPAELSLIRSVEENPCFGRLGEFAEVDVGIVTGRNNYFVLSQSEAAALGLTQHCTPLVGRSAQIPGLVLRASEWSELSNTGEKCLLLNIGDITREDLTEHALEYITAGEQSGIDNGYKCRIRKPNWWRVPSVWTPGAFLLRQIHEGARIVLNQAGVTCTDTIHRLRIQQDVSPEWIAGVSMNSVTLAFSEIRGRSYGGGVLELEPTEAEGLPFPKDSRKPVPLDRLDKLVRSRDTHRIADAVDQVAFHNIDLSKADIITLRGVWQRLYKRRSGRRRN